MKDLKLMKREYMLYAFSIILGMLFFVMIYGVNVLNPFYTDWLFGKAKDLSQHYLGWEFYRKGAWTFPIGMTDQIAYPTYTSVIFTDSIPLFAVFFKLLSPFLPDSFQYFGWWGIVCFALQAFFAVKILREFSVGRLQALIGCVFFVISPTVIEKMFRHTALGGHWIILASIYLFVTHQKNYNNIPKTTIQWGIIGGLIAAIHLYYLPMCGIFVGVYVLCSFFKEKRINIRYVIPFVSFMVTLLVNTYLLGGFSSAADMGSDGLGDYSFNLNGFFNEKGYSRFFEPLKTYKDGQYEGFAYLGLGIFVLMAVAAVYMLIRFIKDKRLCDKNNLIYMVAYAFISVILIFFSASPQVTFNDKLIFEFPDIDIIIKYWSVFRSSGRMIWPVCYLIILSVIVCNDRLSKIISDKKGISRYMAVIILSVCTILQVADLSQTLHEQRKNFAAKVNYSSPLKEKVWQHISNNENIEHVVCASNHFETIDYLNMAKYAHDNDLTMNNFYFARGIDIRENLKYSLGHLDDKSIYIFKADDKDVFSKYDLQYFEADGYVVGIKQ